MNVNPLDIINKLDSELFKNVAGTKDMALEGGALEKKYKLLIALALDASHGTVDGHWQYRPLKVGQQKRKLWKVLG